MDIPDKIIMDSDVRLWRFRASCSDWSREADLEFGEEVPFPIMAAGVWIGAASIRLRSYDSQAQKSEFELLGVCDASIPERLDFDTGSEVYIVPQLVAGRVSHFIFDRAPGAYGVLVEADIFYG